MENGQPAKKLYPHSGIVSTLFPVILKSVCTLPHFLSSVPPLTTTHTNTFAKLTRMLSIQFFQLFSLGGKNPSALLK